MSHMIYVHLPRKFHAPVKMSILGGFLVSGSALSTLGLLFIFWSVGDYRLGGTS